MIMPYVENREYNRAIQKVCVVNPWKRSFPTLDALVTDFPTLLDEYGRALLRNAQQRDFPVYVTTDVVHRVDDWLKENTTGFVSRSVVEEAAEILQHMSERDRVVDVSSAIAQDDSLLFEYHQILLPLTAGLTKTVAQQEVMERFSSLFSAVDTLYNALQEDIEKQQERQAVYLSIAENITEGRKMQQWHTKYQEPIRQLEAEFSMVQQKLPSLRMDAVRQLSVPGEVDSEAYLFTSDGKPVLLPTIKYFFKKMLVSLFDLRQQKQGMEEARETYYAKEDNRKKVDCGTLLFSYMLSSSRLAQERGVCLLTSDSNMRELLYLRKRTRAFPARYRA